MVALRQPTLQARGSSDEDGDAFSYRFLIRSETGDVVAESESVPAEPGALVEWRCDVELTGGCALYS